ncbi:hypothetical protein PM082_013550 [Marasmius tenuissimus]|nr:hypothetical protein PM082_013550 [Marasmius tenuissimus]
MNTRSVPGDAALTIPSAANWPNYALGWAVDYSKHGNALDLHSEDSPDQLPTKLIRCNPDWHQAEVLGPRKIDYESTRALGWMYRKVSKAIPEDNYLQRLVDAVNAATKPGHRDGLYHQWVSPERFYLISAIQEVSR